MLRRRNSLKERSPNSPEREYYDRSNPPTLPRRGHGPPSFVPTPPSDRDPPRHQAQSHDIVSSVPEVEKPKLRKVQPKPPPEEPSMDNELLKKLMRRQNKIKKAEEEGVCVCVGGGVHAWRVQVETEHSIIF